jgi:hypothetical protein
MQQHFAFVCFECFKGGDTERQLRCSWDKPNNKNREKEPLSDTHLHILRPQHRRKTKDTKTVLNEHRKKPHKQPQTFFLYKRLPTELSGTGRLAHKREPVLRRCHFRKNYLLSRAGERL